MQGLVTRHLLLLLAALLCLYPLEPRAAPDSTIHVAVRMQGDEVLVDVNFHVRATPQEAWAVMTDYSHATEFISKLDKSVILSRTADTLLVSQEGSDDGQFESPEGLEFFDVHALMLLRRSRGTLLSRQGYPVTKATAKPS